MQLALVVLFRLMTLSGWLNKYCEMMTDSELNEAIQELEEIKAVLDD